MASSVVKNLRVVPRDQGFLSRRLGSNGEIFFDQDSQTLRLYTGKIIGGQPLATSDLSNVSNEDFATKASAAGIGSGGVGGGNFSFSIAGDDSTGRVISNGNTVQFVGGDGISTATAEDGLLTITNDQQAFQTITISGQTDVAADTQNDTLTFVAGSNILLTTSGKEITIAAAAGQSTNSFSTISVSGQPSVVADSGTDTLTLVAGSNISISTNATSDEITISSTAAGGESQFSELEDAVTASLSVSDIYLPAITKLIVDNSGISAYFFDQYTGNNPRLYFISGTTVAFDLNAASGHPFEIQDNTLNPITTGLVHVANDGTVSTNIDAQGQDSGVLYWKIPADASGNFAYQCQNHAAMVGPITVKNIAVI